MVQIFLLVILRSRLIYWKLYLRTLCCLIFLNFLLYLTFASQSNTICIYLATLWKLGKQAHVCICTRFLVWTHNVTRLPAAALCCSRHCCGCCCIYNLQAFVHSTSIWCSHSTTPTCYTHQLHATADVKQYIYWYLYIILVYVRMSRAASSTTAPSFTLN